MKRYAILLLTLALLGAAGMVCAHRVVGASAEAVEMRETVLYGDRAAAEGVELRHKSWCSLCSWDSLLSIGAVNTCSTRFGFDLEGSGENERQYDGVRIGFFLPSYYERAPGRDLTGKYEYMRLEQGEFDVSEGGLARLLQETAGQAAYENGRVHKRQARLNDYIDYLPVEISVDLPCASGNEERHSCVNDREQIERRLEEYFRFPLPEDCMVNVTVEEDSGGYISEWSVEFADGWRPGAYVFNAVTENACYFALTDTTGETDLEALPGGKGVYCLPLEREGGCTRVKTEDLATVYALGSGDEVEEIDVHGDKLLLLLRRGDELRLTCVELDGTGTAHSIPMLSYAGENRVRHVVLEDGSYYLETEDGRFAFAVPAEDGGYRVWLSADIEDPDRSFDASGWGEAISWDGERMLIANSFVDRIFGPYGKNELGMILSVYDETGLLCRLRYDSSLADAPYVIPKSMWRGERPVTGTLISVD